MNNNRSYPKHLSYEQRKLKPSVLFQEFPLPSLDKGEVYYPVNRHLEHYFTTDEEAQLFGAVQFCSFLNDTIEVEHGLVIPAVATLRRLPFKIPPKPKQELFKTATDEGHHAEQSLAFLTALEDHFGIIQFSNSVRPLFMRRLEHQRSMEDNSILKDLVTVLNGVVTETRISIELGNFVKNHDLSDSIKEICKSHAQDEVIHASQFQALGQWLWEDFDDGIKALASKFYVDSTIARSLPDIDNLITSVSNTTGRNLQDSANIVLAEYNEDILIDEMLFAAEPTIKFLEKLGIGNHISFSEEIEKEQKKLGENLSSRRTRLKNNMCLIK
jgi:hypothetical protein